MDFVELVQEVDSAAALRFFYENLKDVVPTKRVTREEVFHVASILASFAQDYKQPGDLLPPSQNLSEFFDQFVVKREVWSDLELLMNACAQNLLLNGFFREHMRRRHNVGWYDRLGCAFYERATKLSSGPNRRSLFGKMSRNFPIWTETCSTLNTSFRQNSENQYLLRLQ